MTRNPSLLERPVAVTSMVDQVVARLEAAIISGELKAGLRLSEQALAAGMGISRGPLREALRRLEGRGLIERTPHLGARVTELFGKKLEEILVVRESLESLACRLAATKISDQDMEELETILAKHEARAGAARAGAYHESPDHDFHRAIIQASENQKLMDILFEDIYYLMRFHRYRSGSTPGRAEAALQEHRAIFAAIKARAPEKAEQAMRTHLTNAHANIRAQNVAE